MSTFWKAFGTTMAIGFAAMGIYVGLLVLRAGIEIAGFMLGSTVGTILFALIMWKVYEKFFKEKFSKIA